VKPPFAALLFDIDGTLVRAGGAGRRAFERALEDHHGPVDGRIASLRFDGMTDRLIVRESMARLGRSFDEAACDAVLDRYVEHLRGEIGGAGYRVLPGVRALLEALAAPGAPRYGLCTGNVVAGARVKLAQGGLDRFFDWSGAGLHGFAEDGEARERVVAAALRRVSAAFGRPVRPDEVLIIGDTPRDVAAAHAVGCLALGVATGNFSPAELAAAGADEVAESLEAPAARRLVWPAA
jgi:phosphoglycolate phosphatase